VSRPASEYARKAGKVVALAFSEPVDKATIRGVIDWGKTHNWHMIRLDQWKWEVPAGIEPDGLITFLGLGESQMARRLQKSIPTAVSIGSYEKPSTVPDIHIDENAVGEQAAEYFWDRGFRNFAVAAFNNKFSFARLTSFKKRIEERGAACALITGLSLDDIEIAGAYKIFRQRISDTKYPLAIFCCNDLLASHICQWSLQSGLAVPEQVAILGSGNDITTCECSPVPISSVDSQPGLRGTEAARVLQQLMDGAFVPPGCIKIPPAGIVTRRSTDITALPNLSEARALRYIWDHFREDIGPAQVSAACGICIRTLDRRFKASLGHTVAREIRARRLRAACDMLRDENMKVIEVAAQVGFKSPQHFNYRFKKDFGMTPQAYRETSSRS
jgi:LacI family transcriptional regulator